MALNIHEKGFPLIPKPYQIVNGEKYETFFASSFLNWRLKLVDGVRHGAVPKTRSAECRILHVIIGETGGLVKRRSALMFRTESKYCLIITSYLAGVFDIFTLFHI